MVPLTGGTPRKKTKLLKNTFAIENSFQLVRQKHERYRKDAFSANYPCQWQPLMNDVHQQQQQFSSLRWRESCFFAHFSLTSSAMSFPQTNRKSEGTKQNTTAVAQAATAAPGSSRGRRRRYSCVLRYLAGLCTAQWRSSVTARTCQTESRFRTLKADQRRLIFQYVGGSDMNRSEKWEEG